MAFTSNISNGSENNQKIITVEDGKDINIGSSDYISNSDLVRDGSDLVLNLEDGSSVKIQNYFSMETPPVINSADGKSLTPDLVDSFVRDVDAGKYAMNDVANDASPVGEINEVTGSATITRTDGTIVEVSMGTKVYEGDIVETVADGALNIVFSDESSFAVSSNAKLAIDEYVYSPEETGEGTSNFSFLKGVFLYTSGIIGRDDPDDVNIETPVGSIGIRGTVIAADIPADGSEVRITVLEGAIVVKNAVSEVTISNQFETVKIHSNDHAISNDGVMSAGDVSNHYGAVKHVSPTIFTSIEDSMQEDASQDENIQEDVSEEHIDEVEAEKENHDDVNEENVDDVEAEKALHDEVNEEIKTKEDRRDNKDDIKVKDANNKEKLADSNEEVGGKGNSIDDVIDKKISLKEAIGEKLTGETVIDLGDALKLTIDSNIADLSGSTVNILPVFSATVADALINNDRGARGGRDAGDDATFIRAELADPDLDPIAGITTPIKLDGDFYLDGKSFKINFTGGSHSYGYGISAGGDIDGDGFADFIISDNINVGSQSIVIYGKADALTSGEIGDFSNLYKGSWTFANVDERESQLSGGGDFDGDGRADFVISSQYGKELNSDAVFDGRITISDNSGEDTYANTARYGDDEDDGIRFGSSIDYVGDFNGDGYDDIFVGAQEFGGDERGGIYFIEGGRALNGFYTASLDPIKDGSDDNDNLGVSLAGVGDLNKDGYDDVVVGSEAGYVLVGLGDDASPVWGTIINTGNALFGKDVASLGDIDNDGRGDFVISNGVNEAYIIYGSFVPDDGSTLDLASGYSLSQAIKLTSVHEISYVGSVGDFNGDGYDDFAVVQKIDSTYNIFIIQGKNGNYSNDEYNIDDLATKDNVFKFQYEASFSTDEFNIESAGDINGDGYDDLLMGTPDENGDEGAIWVHYGFDYNNKVKDGLTTISGDVGVALVGTSGNDTFYLGVKKNVSVNAGAGDDIINLNGDMGNAPRNLDGGLGSDTLNINGTGNLDFRNIESLNSIGKIDMNNGFDNIIRLRFDQIMDMAEYNNTNEQYELYIEGDADDAIRVFDVTGISNVAGGFTIDGIDNLTVVLGGDINYLDVSVIA